MERRRARVTARTLVAVLFITGAVSLPSSASAIAGDGIKLGAARLHPSLDLTVTYDSNIFLEASDPTDDFITNVEPSLRLTLPMRRLMLEAEGGIGFERYADNDTDDNEVYFVSGSLGGAFPGGLGFTVADRLSRDYLKTQPEFDVAEYIDINQLYLRASYAIRDTFKIELEYFNYDYAYDKTDDLDRSEDVYSGTLFYKFRPRMSLLLELAYSEFSYDEEAYGYKDSQSRQVRGGLTWDVTGKTTGEFRVGWQKRDYDDSDLDENHVVAMVGTHTAFSQYTALDLELKRATVENDYEANPHYLTTQLDAELSRKLTYKMTAKAGLFARWDDYPNETLEEGGGVTRRDDVLGGRLGLDFQMFRWLMLKARYELQARDSNVDRFDFDLQRASLTANLAY